MALPTKTQASGTGLAILSTLLPTLGIQIPYWARVAGVALGIAMLIWPGLVWAFNSIRTPTETTLRRAFYSGCALTALAVWYTAGVPMEWLVLVASNPGGVSRSISGETPKNASPPAPPPRVTEATPERAVYKCKRSESSAQKTDDARYAEFKKYIEVYADTNGFAAKVTSVPGGFKAELTAATPLGQKSMGSATKMTLEVRTLGKELLGIFSAEYPATLWFGYLLPSSSGPEIKIRKRIEDLVGADPGGCELQ
jgi:hypothetical protein